jgi:CBS domain-containing protein
MARQITDIMTPQPECCTPDDSVIEVARVMEMRDVGVVPIVESQDTRRIVGVITDRDIVLRVVAPGYDPNEIVSVRDIMTNELVTCTTESDVLHVEELMKERKVRRVLVLDDHGAVVGIVSMADLAQKADEMQVGDTEKAITQP